jgi:hypothetical protein
MAAALCKDMCESGVFIFYFLITLTKNTSENDTLSRMATKLHLQFEYPLFKYKYMSKKIKIKDIIGSDIFV